MKIIRGLHDLKAPIKNSVITIGVFDGVHIGHRHIIKKAIDRARALKTVSVIVTFEPNPAKVTNPKHNVPSLISLDHRVRLMEELGADNIVVINFTKHIARLSPEDFVRKILIDKLGAREICVGENFYFGKGGKAGVNTLKELGKKLSFRAHIIKTVKVAGSVVSSSLIRHFIIKGELSKAARLLGRPVAILGTVVSGSQLGRRLGYPTANVNPHHEAIPPSGVYVVRVRYAGRIYKGILNIGTRPTFHIYSHAVEPTIEVHIFGFNKKIYNRDIEILFMKKLRDEKRFDSIEELIAQIKADERRARKIFFTKF